MLTKRQVSYLLLIASLLALPFADISIVALNPWQELRRFALGAVTPDFYDFSLLLEALVTTIAFALLGVAFGSAAGMLLATLFRYRLVRMCCAFVRAIHELFWALIFLQIFGLHPLTGLLALALPYAGTFAKVYAEILDEADQTPIKLLPHGTANLSRFVYAQIAPAWEHIKNYTLYRTECGFRSSAILGFIGLPTIGYYLESAFLQGQYSQVSALLISFFVLIATMPYWLRKKLIPFYLIAAALYLGSTSIEFSASNLLRFVTEDIVPYPLRSSGSATDLWLWLKYLLTEQAIPGIIQTLILAQIALAVSGLFALWLFPIISRHFYSRNTRFLGHGLLIVLRSTPEYILAFFFLQMWGPSMLPAIVALMLHNGSIMAHLIGRYSNEIPIRTDAPGGLNLYGYEIVPRIYGQFLAFLLYRWEIIMRETAILGMLGIATLGFYIDDAMQDLRFDRAIVLIVITAFLNIGIDMLSRWLRKWTL